MANWYERYEQSISITAESSYGTPHEDGSSNGGTAWTALEAAYEDLKRINIIPSGTTVPLPKINKIKKYDISDSKYPSKVASGNRDPIRFTMDLELIYPVFLAYAVGTATTAKTQLVAAAAAASGDGTRVITFDGAADLGSVEAGDIAIVTGGTNDNGYYKIASVDNDDDNVTVESRYDVFNNESGIDCEIVDYWTHTVQESKTSELESFTMHCEQGNPNAAAQDIVYDLFGCVIEEYRLTINKGNQTVKESVTIACPACAYSTANMNTGSDISDSLPDDIYAWNDLLEDVSSSDGMSKTTTMYLIQSDGSPATNLTPTALENVELTVSNGITFLPDLEKRHMVYAVATTRSVAFTLSGYITTKTLLTYWEEVWDESVRGPNTAGAALQGCVYLERASDDYIFIPINNLMIDEHSMEFSSIDEGIKGADMTFTAGTPMAGASGRLFYCTDDSKDIEIADGRNELWYHNTT